MSASEDSPLSQLQQLVQQGYVLHGSPRQLQVLLPHQAYSHGQPDGPPTICATENPHLAIFRSLIHCCRNQAQGLGTHHSA